MIAPQKTNHSMLQELTTVDEPGKFDADSADPRLAILTTNSSLPQSKSAAVNRLVEAYRYPIALSIIVFCAFVPTMAQPRLFMDDYEFLYGNTRAEVIAFFTSIGRPLTAGYLMVCRDFIHHQSSLELCYLIGIAGAILLATVSYSWFRRNSMESLDAALLSLLIVLLPSVQVYVSWITAGSSTYAAVLATCALLVFDSGRASSDHLFSWRNWGRSTIAVTALVAALMTYQPAGLFFWSMAIASMLFRADESPRQRTWRGISYLTLSCGSIMVYLACFRGIVQLTGLQMSERAKIVAPAAVWTKLEWFVSEPLRNALALWFVPGPRSQTVILGASCPTPNIIAPIVLLILAGMIAWWWREASRSNAEYTRSLRFGTLRWLWPLAPLAVVVVMIPLSYVFNLIVVESWAAYRTTFALAAACLVSVYASADALLWCFGQNVQVLLRRTALAACAIVALFAAQQRLLQEMIYPQLAEIAHLQLKLSRADLSTKNKIHIIRPAWHQGVCANVCYDEIGLPSSNQAWVPVSMVRKALCDRGLRPDGFQITHGSTTDAIPTGGDIVTIDMRELALLRSKPALK